ncbi:MAG: hypothetical protein ACLUR5_07650 [Eubacterium ventriosum]
MNMMLMFLECDDKYYYSDGSGQSIPLKSKNTPYMSECVENAEHETEN